MKKTVAMFLLLVSHLAVAGNWSIGAAGLYAENAYRDTKATRLIIPIISYHKPYLSIYGPVAKIRYAVDPNNILGLVFHIGMQDYDPDDSSNLQMKSLQRRKRLFYIGPFYQHRTVYGDFTTNILGDVTGRSRGGLYSSFQYSYSFKEPTMKYYIRPAVGIRWTNKKVNQHFYAINATESTASGFTTYTLSHTVAPYASLLSSIRLIDNIYWTSMANVSYVPNTITNSPMSSGRHVTYSLISGFTFEIGAKDKRFNH